MSAVVFTMAVLDDVMLNAECFPFLFYFLLRILADAKSSDLADFTWPPGTHYRIAWFISRGSAEYSPNGEDLLMNAVLREATCKWLKQRNILHVEVSPHALLPL